MKRKILVVFLMALLLTLAVSVAYVRGHTSDQLDNGGWTCINTGDFDWVHCFPPSVDFPGDLINGNRSTIQVKVFDVEGYPYLGTEILVHQDIYNGQPCMADNGDAYHFLGFAPYYACHHFERPEHD